MGLVDFQVILDNPIKVFFSGQTVSGRVLVTVSEAKKMARLKVELVGQGQVHWTEQRQQTRPSLLPLLCPEKGGLDQSSWQPSAAPPPFSPYPDLPPPTYAESVWGASDVRDQEDDEHTGGQFEFVPRYVTYTTRY